jgi:hypothetical protein
VIPIDQVTPEELVAIPTSSTSRPGGLIADPENCEITLFSMDNKFSQTYPLTYIDAANRKIFWSEYDDQGNSFDYNGNGTLDTRPLPLEFYNVNGTPEVGRVVLRTVRPADFSWLLTVRRGSDGQARGVDVVVRYHTDTKLTDERIYAASFVAGSGVIGVRAIGDPQPNLKRGGFIFDARNARWYRITNYEARPLIVPSSEANFWKFYEYRILVETPVISDAGSFPTSSADAVYSGAMFLPGIVDVYPIGSLSLPDSL